MESKKIIYVDVDGTICDNPTMPDFADQSLDYSKAEPHYARIDVINNLYDKGPVLEKKDIEVESVAEYSVVASSL